VAGCQGRCGGCWGRLSLGCVLGCALGLKLGGVEDAVVAVGAYGEGLSVVLEGVGRGLCALIVDVKGAALLEELEGGVGSYAVDAAGGDVAGYAEVANVGFVAHALKLADGDVVALVVADAGEGEISDGHHDDDGGDDDFDRTLLGFVRHRLHV